MLLIVPCLSTDYAPLFSIEKDDKVSYGFGSFHPLPFEELPLPVQSILKKGKYLAKEELEALKILDDKEFCEKNDFFCKNKQENPISQLDPSVQEQCNKLFTHNLEKLGLTFKLEDFSPWVAMLAALMPVPVYENGMDARIASFYPAQNTYLLETPEEMLPIYKKVVPPFEVFTSPAFLHAVEKNFNERNDILYSNLYRQSSFKEQILQTNLNTPTPIVTERTDIWIPKIEKYHAELDGNVIFLGGIYHWLGRHGILNKLYQKGYQLKIFEIKGESGTFQPLNIEDVLE